MSAIMRPALTPSRRQLAKRSPPQRVQAGWMRIASGGTPAGLELRGVDRLQVQHEAPPQPRRTNSPANCAATSPPTS